MSPKDIEIDDKTLAVFKKKGYKVLDVLGEGAFGKVYKAKIVDSGKFAAVKVTDLSSANEVLKSKFLPQEMSAMIQSKHKHVIRVYDIIKANHKLYIFMEFAANGDIFGFVKKNGPLSISKANLWFGQSCEGVDYLHNTLYIAHRDLKLDNILLDDKNNAKIGDFGFAKKFFDSNNNTVVLSTTFCGTIMYKCPELVKREAYDPYKADVWAMGVCLFAMLNDKYPFGGSNTMGDTFQMNKQMESTDFLEKRYIKEFCKHVRRLIKKMCDYRQDDRYSIKDVLQSKWVQTKGKCCD